MGALRPRPVVPAARLEIPVEEWPYLDEGVLLKTRSRKVCMTCHWFCHHAGVNCTPVLTRRCQGWTDDMTRQRGWCGARRWHEQPTRGGGRDGCRRGRLR